MSSLVNEGKETMGQTSADGVSSFGSDTVSTFG